MATATEREQVAHVLRRCGFGPQPGGVETWEDAGAAALVEYLLGIENVELAEPGQEFDGLPNPDDNEYQFLRQAAARMCERMVRGSNPLHERMTWYWHTHLTTSVERSGAKHAWVQHHLLRRHALGHFPTLIREITTDAAMLQYLDGSGSRADMPNENYAREMLELFTLGRNGGYTEDDVRAAARILAGWRVDYETDEVLFEAEYAYTRPVTFMGERRRWSLDEFIEFVCAQPACALHVVTRLYHHLVGPDLTEARRDELAAVFVEAGLEIKPLVAAIVTGDDFLAAQHSRARQPIEWLLGARAAIDADVIFDPEAAWWFEDMNQIPFNPPNVAGWPLDGRWASASQIIARSSILFDWDLAEHLYDEVEPTAAAVLARCGVFEPSASTLAALEAVEADFSEYDDRLSLLFATVLLSPEFTLL